MHKQTTLFFVDILAGDPQLAAEIEFDLRRFEKEQNKLQTQAVTIGMPSAQVMQITYLAYVYLCLFFVGLPS